MDDREKVINVCAEIFQAVEEVSPDENLGLVRFLTWITAPGFDFLSGVLEKSELKFEGETAEDVLTDGVWMPLAETAFGIGFALGNLLAPSTPFLKDKLEAIKGIINGAGFASFVPREKGGSA